MSLYPQISRGLGKLTPELWRRLMDMLQWHETHRELIELKGPKRRETPRRAAAAGKSFFMAEITSNDAVVDASNRWMYQWRAVDALWEPIEGGAASDPGDETTYALNLAEAKNDGQALEGYGVNISTQSSPDFSVIVQVVPIIAGSIVPMWVEAPAEGPRYRFAIPNEIRVRAKCAASQGIGAVPV